MGHTQAQFFITAGKSAEAACTLRNQEDIRRRNYFRAGIIPAPSVFLAAGVLFTLLLADCRITVVIVNLRRGTYYFYTQRRLARMHVSYTYYSRHYGIKKKRLFTMKLGSTQSARFPRDIFSRSLTPVKPDCDCVTRDRPHLAGNLSRFVLSSV